MSDLNAATLEPAKPPSPEDVVADAIARHLAGLGVELSANPLPSKKQLEELLLLSRLRESLKPPKKETAPRRRLFNVLLIVVLAAILLWAGFHRVASTAAEFNIKASSIQMEFEGGGKGPPIPGEDEEALALTYATVSGIEHSDLPPGAGIGNSLQLNQAAEKDALPIRLQQFVPPETGPFTLTLDTSYQPKGHGLVLTAPSDKNSPARTHL